MATRLRYSAITLGILLSCAASSSARAGAAGGGSSTLVFEAEEATTVLGKTWELRGDESASGSAVLYCPEGTGRNNGNEYTPPRYSFLGRAHYDIQVPPPGTYVLSGRCWSRDGCSNSCGVGFDDGEPLYFPEGRKGADEYIWEKSSYNRWLWLKSAPGRLTAGLHRVHVYVREDGFRIDQWALVRSGDPAPADSPTADKEGRLEPNCRPLPPARTWMRADARSRLVGPARASVVSVWIRRGRDAPDSGRLEIAAPDGASFAGFDPEISLAEGQALARVDVKLAHAEDFPRGEHEYAFTFVPSAKIGPSPLKVADKTGAVTSSTRLVRPFRWEVLAPLRLASYPSYEAAPLTPAPADWPAPSEVVGGGRQHAQAGGPGRGRTTDDTARGFNAYGFLDFRLALVEVEYAKAFVRTKVVAPEAGRYLFIVLCDDKCRMWMNDRLVYSKYENRPATERYAMVYANLKKGENALALTVTQHRGQWMMRVRIRKPGGGLSGVVGGHKSYPRRPATRETR